MQDEYSFPLYLKGNTHQLLGDGPDMVKQLPKILIVSSITQIRHFLISYNTTLILEFETGIKFEPFVFLIGVKVILAAALVAARLAICPVKPCLGLHSQVLKSQSHM